MPDDRHAPASTPAAASLLAPELRLGGLSVSWLVFLLLLQVFLAAGVAGEVSGAADFLWLAAIWSGWSVSVWIFVRQPLRPGRVVGLGLVVAWHCLWMSVARGAPPERYFVMLGSYGLLQSLACTILGMPTWRLWGEAPSTRPTRGRFNILAVMLATAVVALVLVATRRYVDTESPAFLSGTLAINGLVLWVALTAMLGGGLRRFRILSWWALIVTAALCAVIAALSEGPQDARQWDFYLGAYGMIMFAFGTFVRLAATAGRLDAERPATS